MKKLTNKIKTTALVTLLGLSINTATAGDLSFKMGFGLQKNDTALQLGLEKKDFISKRVFITKELTYNIMKSNTTLTDISSIRYNDNRVSREDITINLGLGYDFGKVNVIGYVGIGKSSKETINNTLEKETRDIEDKEGKVVGTREVEVLKSSTINKISDLRQEVGIKLNYKTESLTPFVDFKRIKYNNEKSNNSIIVGFSIDF